MSERTIEQRTGPTWRLDSDLEAVCRWYLENSDSIIAEAETYPRDQQMGFVQHVFEQLGMDAESAFAQFEIITIKAIEEET